MKEKIFKVTLYTFALIGVMSALFVVYILGQIVVNFQNQDLSMSGDSIESLQAEYQELEFEERQCAMTLVEKFHPTLVGKYFINIHERSKLKDIYGFQQEMSNFLKEKNVTCKSDKS